MRATLKKARNALLTDPATGLPLSRAAILDGAVGLYRAVIVILLLIGGALGVTP